MNAKHLGVFCLILPLLPLPLASAQPDLRLLPAVEFTQEKEQPKQPGKEKDKDKKPPEKKVTDPPETDIFAQPPAPVSEQLGFTPQMMGDFYGTFARANVSVLGTQTVKTVTIVQVPPGETRQTTTVTTGPATQQRYALVPIANYGAFKVAENASPMPVDRVFFTYNFYSGIRSDQGDLPAPVTTQRTTYQQSQRSVVYTQTTTVFPAQTAAFANLHRETFGFEKTFLAGRASVEMRLPIFQQTSGLDDFRSNQFGDLTVIGKYALYLNRQTGDVLSGGLALTAPTGTAIQTIDGQFHSTLLQPWIGYIWNVDRFYVHAFHSAVLPTDSRDVSLLFNDAGIGYWLMRGTPDQAVRFVVPTFEAHLTTPLTNRNTSDATFVPDLLVLTTGVHVGLFRNSILSFGVGAPITGPRVYGMEAFMQYNRRF